MCGCRASQGSSARAAPESHARRCLACAARCPCRGHGFQGSATGTGDLLAFADGRAQLPGESVSRLHLRSLGFDGIRLQSRVEGVAGEEYWLDFAFPAHRVFGEFDGRGKYVDGDFRGERSAEMVVLASYALAAVSPRCPRCPFSSTPPVIVRAPRCRRTQVGVWTGNGGLDVLRRGREGGGGDLGGASGWGTVAPTEDRWSSSCAQAQDE